MNELYYIYMVFVDGVSYIDFVHMKVENSRGSS